MSTQSGTAQRFAPSPGGFPLVGVLPYLLQDPLRYVSKVLRQHGDIVRLPLGFGQVHMISHPDYAQKVLRDCSDNYDRSILVKPLRRVFGDGMGTSEGQVWLQKRRRLNPIFSRQRIAELAPLMISAATEALGHWPPPTARAEFDIAEGLDHIAMKIILRAMFDTDLSETEMDTLGDAVQLIIDHIGLCAWTEFFPAWIPMPGAASFLKAIHTIDKTIYRIIVERRQRRQRQQSGSEPPRDLIHLLLNARDLETGETMDDVQVRDEAVAFFMAGYETTSTAVTWTLYLLSQHPEIDTKLRAELTAVLGGRLPTEAELGQLHYTRMVFQESMRLYPPGWLMARRAKADDTIGGYHIPANSFIGILTHAVHRHPAFWDAPEAFRPERFLPEPAAARHRFAYLPFGAGPRQCIGGGLAMMEGPLLLALILQRYRMKPVPGHPVTPKPALTLYPRHGIRMTLEPV